MILSNLYKNGGGQDLNLQSHTTASTYPIGKPLHCHPAFYNCLILSEDYINAVRREHLRRSGTEEEPEFVKASLPYATL